jgi:hypothetical protein
MTGQPWPGSALRVADFVAVLSEMAPTEEVLTKRDCDTMAIGI